MARYVLEPFKIKSVEPIHLTTPEERESFMREAGYNVFSLPSRAVTVDLLTDSGTSAMSDSQWAGMMKGDESYSGSANYFELQRVVRDIFGFDQFVPTHQGRGAEQVLFAVTAGPGKVIPNNTHFDTTRANVESRGSEAVDLIIPEGLEPTNRHPFKGNMNVLALQALIERVGAPNVPLAMMTITNNAVGGQPVSMANIRETKALLDRYHIPLFVDACRYAENCYFIQQREPGYRDKSIKDIARELFSYADGFTMSAKKDGLVNIGGLLAARDPELFGAIQNRLILTEGFISYGGLARRDLQALAIGLEEGISEEYLAYRIGQVNYVGERLLEAGVPIVEPPGGHAVFLDARRFLPDIPLERYPAEALSVALYLAGGIRASEIGSVMFAHKDAAGKEVFAPLELVRLAIPRRVYTQSHLDYVVEVISDLYRDRKNVRGVQIVYQAPHLRHFTARFELL
ncbi:MAG: tryptophanase [Chloroflexi bacterium]|nr:tryptophanase [Chloroflexota bacterium]